jgi:hypothetical protein
LHCQQAQDGKSAEQDDPPYDGVGHEP